MVILVFKIPVEFLKAYYLTSAQKVCIFAFFRFQMSNNISNQWKNHHNDNNHILNVVFYELFSTNEHKISIILATKDFFERINDQKRVARRQ